MPTAAQIEQQVRVNVDSIEKLHQQMEKAPQWSKPEISKRINQLWQAQNYWFAEYKKLTGKELMVTDTIVIYKSDVLRENEQMAEAVAKQQAAEKAKRRITDAIQTVRREHQQIALALQAQYDIAVHWRNAMFSHWTRMGAGLHAKHPLYIKSELEKKVGPLLLDAERLLENGSYDKAWKKTAEAAGWVKWGFDSLSWWMNQLEKGADRAVAAIKVSAALATIIVSAPVAMGVGGAMAVAAVAEGSMQGYTLILKGVSPGDTVSADDMKDAALAVAVNGATAGLGKGFGSIIGRGLRDYVAKTLLKEGVEAVPWNNAIAFIEARIEQYIAANAQAIANKMLKLDKDPDWNWWYMMIAPAINPIAMEMTKEPELNKLLKKPK